MKKERSNKPPVPMVDPALPRAAKLHQDISQRAMLVNLTVHQWLANATDYQISDEVAQRHDIDASMGRYQKSLFGPGALVMIRATANKLRKTHKTYTLPWDDMGTRILASQAFMTYNAAMNGLIEEYNQIVHDEFAAVLPSGLSKYEELKREAKRMLNGAYRESDYPSLAQVKSKYGAKVRVLPIPSGTDFRIDLGAEVTAQVRRSIEEQAGSQVEQAMKTLYERLQFLVNRLVEALRGEKVEAIRKSLFTSIYGLLDSFPMLNVTGDPTLEIFSNQVRQIIDGLNAEELREGPALRAAVLERADAILAQVNDFLG